MTDTALPYAPAVYAFENTENGKLYIGSSVNARRRVQHHFYLLKCGRHRNPYLQRAYDKHGRERFRVFALEILVVGCTAKDLLVAEQKWISAFATAEPAHGYNIHPTPIGSDFSQETSQRLKTALTGRRRGILTEVGRKDLAEGSQRAWMQPGEREYRSEIMREIWATQQHRDKLAANVAQRLADPVALAAMRARMQANRITPEQKRAVLSAVWWKRHAGDKFPLE